MFSDLQIQAAGYGMKGMAANVKLAEAMGETSKTMGQMNKAMDPAKIAKTMNDFEMANAKMSMTEETSKIATSFIIKSRVAGQGAFCQS